MAKRLTFDPKTNSLSDCLEELNDCAEGELADTVQHMIHCLLYAKLPPLRKLSFILAYLENGTFYQTSARLE